MKDNKKGCRVKKNYSLMLYQRVMGDFYPINSEGKFTLSEISNGACYNNKCVILSLCGDKVFLEFSGRLCFFILTGVKVDFTLFCAYYTDLTNKHNFKKNWFLSGGL